MKKTLAILMIAAFGLGLASCSTCGSCTDSNGNTGAEVCDGNTIEDAAYELSKSTCEAAGGTWAES